MSAAMQRRIEALESADKSGVDFILVLWGIVRPGERSTEATQAEMLGQRFEREPDETQPEFIERLRSYALTHRRPGQHGVQVLMGENDLDL